MTCGCSKRVDVCVTQNNTREFRFRIQDSAGNYLDVADFTSLTWIIATRRNGTALLTKTTADSSITTLNTTTWRTILSTSDTGGLLNAKHHELTATSTAGDVVTVFTGRFTCENILFGD